MSYLIQRAFFTFEDGPDKAIVLDKTVEDLDMYKELLIKENNAKNVYLNYEQEDNNSDSSSSPSLIDFIKPLIIEV